MTTFSFGASVSDSITISSLSSITDGSYSQASSLIDNTPSNAHGFAYINGLLRLSLSAAVTAGSGSPYLQVFVLTAADGSTLVSPPGAGSATAPRPNQLSAMAQLIASTNYQVVDIPLPELPPMQIALQIFNNSGVNFSGTVSATLYRWNVIGA